MTDGVVVDRSPPTVGVLASSRSERLLALRGEQPVTAVARLGELVGTEAQEGLGLHELVYQRCMILGQLVDVVDDLAPLVADEAVMLELAGRSICSPLRRARPSYVGGLRWSSPTVGPISPIAS